MRVILCIYCSTFFTKKMKRRRKRELKRSNISYPWMHRIQRAGNACRKINIIHARLRMNLSRHLRLFHDIGRVSSKTSEIPSFRKITKAASPFTDRRDAFRMPQGEMFSPAIVHVERKLYRQLLRKLSRRAMDAFLSLFFSTTIGTAPYETWQQRGRRGWRRGLKCGFTRRSWTSVPIFWSLVKEQTNRHFTWNFLYRWCILKQIMLMSDIQKNFFHLLYFNLSKKFLSPHWYKKNINFLEDILLAL